MTTGTAPVQPVLIDFESRSRASLKTLGGRLYWAHPTTEALCCAWHDLATDDCGVWLPGEGWPHPGRVLVAHNAKHFDQFGARRYRFGAAGWIDSSDLARRGGLPGALEVLGERVGYAKDLAASRFTRGLSTVKRPPKAAGAAYVSPADWKTMTDDERSVRGVQATITGEVLDRVVAYCERDVEVMARAWPDLVDWLDVDVDACALDGVINERGVPMDRDLLSRIVEVEAERFERVVAAEAKRTGASPAELRSLATRPADIAEILGLPCADKVTLSEFGWHPLVRVRQAAASIISGKAVAGLARTSPDGRMRDTLQYYGGHTGRWSGRGMQLQNLSRPGKLDAQGREYESYTDDDIDGLAERVVAGGWAEASDMPVLLRAAIAAPAGCRLIVSDFSGVEARATGWAARDENTLAVFASGADPYKAAAVDIYHVAYDQVDKSQRQIGKIATLALGYQGGSGAFEKMAATYGIDTSALDTQSIVSAWRDAHKATVALWYACQRAFVAAVEQGRSTWVGPFQFVPGSGGEVAAFLPSGRPVVYRDAATHHDGKRVACAHYGQVKPGLWGTVWTYGGKLVENLIQAMCRDLMAESMLACERAGLPVVLSVHDEIVCEAPAESVAEAYAELHQIMCTAPDWAPGFPLTASGFHGRRYRK